MTISHDNIRSVFDIEVYCVINQHWCQTGKGETATTGAIAASESSAAAAVAPTASMSPSATNFGFGLRAVASELAGKRIEVFWGGDNAWYPGKITSYDGTLHTIKYDDGLESPLDLAARDTDGSAMTPFRRLQE